MQRSVLDFQLKSAGLKLPSEELIGQQPSPCQKMDRAYMSNVCTAKAAQRQVKELVVSGNKAPVHMTCAQPYPHSCLLCCIGHRCSVDTSCRSRSYHARWDTYISCLHFASLLGIMLNGLCSRVCRGCTDVGTGALYRCAVSICACCTRQHCSSSIVQHPRRLPSRAERERVLCTRFVKAEPALVAQADVLIHECHISKNAFPCSAFRSNIVHEALCLVL